MPLTNADLGGIAAALAFSAAHHPNADVDRTRELAERIDPACAAYFDAIQWAASLAAAGVPERVVAAWSEYVNDGGSMKLPAWLSYWEIRRSNTPGGLLGDPWPQGPGYHPATPLPDGTYD